MEFKLGLGVGLAVMGFSLAAAPAVTDTPYGVCAHVSRSEELSIATQEFARMREAKINWVRTDFDWSGVEKGGEWNFARLDQLQELARRDGINILPILGYNLEGAHPAWEHLDRWAEYVRRTVGRYAGDLRAWEVWNEPNHPGFWDVPDGKSYAAFLKRTCEEIKKVDPGLTVLYGGTAGVPLDYIENSFKAGAGKYFDVMNIHPYHWDGIPEEIIPRIKTLKRTMEKYGIGDKPIWITEVGWSTARIEPPVLDVLPGDMTAAVLRRAGIDPANATVALVSDPDSGFRGCFSFDVSRHLPMFRNVEWITLAALKGLDVKRCPVLIPAVGQVFPSSSIPALVDYVRRGGTLLLPSGLPFYYDRRPDGTIGQVNDKFMKDFHIGWDAWWTNGNVPKKETFWKPASEFAYPFSIKFRPAGRFLHARNLKPGDEFIPVVEAGTDQYKGVVVALYKLNSDLKGNVITFLPQLNMAESVSEETQAKYLPRTYLAALSHGVERIFWYNFRAGEKDPHEREEHFGIVKKDLSPKSSFQAYKTLSELCPSGSTIPRFLRIGGGVCTASWVRPDGVKIWAIWTEVEPRAVRLVVTGKITEARDYLGSPQPLPGAEYTANSELLYLIGPESVNIIPR